VFKTRTSRRDSVAYVYEKDGRHYLRKLPSWWTLKDASILEMRAKKSFKFI